MIPKIVHQTTKNGLLDYYEEKLLLKNKKMLKGWEFRIWSDVENRKIVEMEFPEFLTKYDAISKGVAKSDIARCMYMYCYGGAYFDTDYEVIKRIPDDLLQKQCILPISRMENSEMYLGNCIFLSEPRHTFWADYIKHIFQNIELSSLEEGRIIDVTGPGGLTKFYLDNSPKYDDLYFPEQRIFHPKVVNHGLRIISSNDTVGVHYCWGSWRSKKPWRIIISKIIREIQILGLFKIE